MRRLVLNRFVVLLFAASLASLEATAVADVAPWEPDAPPLAPGEVLVGAPDGFHRESIEAAEHAGLVIVDLSDTWAPFIFSEQDPGSKTSKPNPYRETFISLANDPKRSAGRAFSTTRSICPEIFSWIPSSPIP